MIDVWVVTAMLAVAMFVFSMVIQAAAETVSRAIRDSVLEAVKRLIIENRK